MNTKQSVALILSIFCVLAISSCTTKAWYEGAKEGAKNNCRSQPQSEVERCLDNLNKKTYEEYDKERSDQQ